MKIYKSTAGCNHLEYAYVTPINRTIKGTNYLCLWSNEKLGNIHTEGEVVENLEDIYLEEVDIDINTLPISKTFLFQFFMRNFPQESLKLFEYI